MIVRVGNESSVELSILPLTQIIPHEKTNPILLEEVLNDLKKTGCQKDPILVDSNSGVILDGMHRREALRILGARFAICALFDYGDSRIKLHRWLRCIQNPNSTILETIKNLFELQETTPEVAINKLENSDSDFAVVYRDKGYFDPQGVGIYGTYEKLGSFDELSKGKGISMKFIRDSDLRDCLNGTTMVLLPKELRKAEVLAIAKSGNILPYKSTRHIVPFRPLGLPHPIKPLQEDNLETNLTLLTRTLAECSPRLVRTGSTYNNRVFEESVVLFS